MTVTEVILRVAISFLVLFLLARMMGRKEISQMTFFNWTSAIGIGSITANLAVNQNLSIRNGVIALMVWTFFTLLMDMVDIKSKRGRKVTTGDPLIVIRNGQIMEGALKKSRLDIDALKAMLRQRDVFSLLDVDYAILETNGQLSVLIKENKQPVTKSDIGRFQTSSTTFPLATEVISDGKINKENLSKLKLDHSWLDQELKKADIQSVSDVFYAEVQPDGSLYFDKRNDIH
ncbi:DUF421 domain-containing protein [Bacillus sp. ISL-47]|uniref:YetF domain-containing protein n=1 Tax=Bacillus sp. ISL-47 TaxID=2819130 RepID=UPI001BEAC317|nr:DUF421 domain-containing protein [Bacillus sp. ISL-47]MBT2686847.1 DUF421 domain-containing protein [Bacillus sp. ISL-47]MBT2706800.1 DUF421 domain-containing protein [Pseudomonas sp. ISL-84]